MIQGFFICGTDTGIGKTWVTAGLLKAFERQQYRTLALKPVASGCRQLDDGLRNDDALLLMKLATEPLHYHQVNPYALSLPVSPHLAALAEDITIDIEQIEKHFRELYAHADICLIEGVGGWLTPLSDRHTVADLAQVLGLPVILVVGIRLGCLNHALLSFEAMRKRIEVAGWVANVIDPDCLMAEAVITSLCSRLDAPLLGTIPYLKSFDADKIAENLDITTLIKDF